LEPCGILANARSFLNPGYPGSGSHNSRIVGAGGHLASAARNFSARGTRRHGCRAVHPKETFRKQCVEFGAFPRCRSFPSRVYREVFRFSMERNESLSGEAQEQGVADTAGGDDRRAIAVQRLFEEHNWQLVSFLAARLRSEQEARDV